MRPPTTKPKIKMNSSAEIHGATNAWIGTRIMRETSRRTIVPRPIQLMPSGTRVSCITFYRSLACHMFSRGSGDSQIGLFKPARCARDFVLRALAHNPAFVDDGDVAAQPLHFFQIVRSQQDGAAVTVDLLQIAPQDA